VDHPQRAPRGLVELGLQRAAEVIDLHVRERVKADDDPVPWGRVPPCPRSHIPPSPPKVRTGLDFEFSVGFGMVWLLSPRDGWFGPQIRVLPPFRLLDGSILPQSRHMVLADGLLSGLQVTTLLPTLTPSRNGPVFQLTNLRLGPRGCSSRPAGQACRSPVSAHWLGPHMRVPNLPRPRHICLLNTGPGGHLFSGFLPFMGAPAKSVLTLLGEFTSDELLWAPGPLGKAGHRHSVWQASASCGHHALPAFPRLSPGCSGLRVGGARRTGWSSARSPLRLLHGALAMSLGRSGGPPGGSECRFQRLLGVVLHCAPIVGLLLLTSGRGHPRFWLHFSWK